MNVVRNVVAGVLALCALAVAAAAHAQNRPLRYAIVSAVGDQLVIVHARSQTGSRLDQNERDIAPLPDNSIDRLVLKHVSRAMNKVGRSAEVAAFTVATKPLFTVQSDVLLGRQPADAPVQTFAKALPENSCDRLLLVLKSRGEVRIPVADGTIGLGRLEGMGFYVDAATNLRSGTSGRYATGFIAPYAYLRVVLADPSGKVLREEVLTSAYSYPLADAPDAVKAWQVLDAEAKYDALDRLLEKDLAAAVQKIVTTAPR